MLLQLPFGIASISGKIGNVVFYSRNGKQYARRLNRHTVSTEALSSECRAILDPLSGVITSPRSSAPASVSRFPASASPRSPAYASPRSPASTQPTASV